MQTGTYRLLGEAGYLSGEERINRSKLADDIVGLLVRQPVEQADEDEIAKKALIVAEIRHRLFNGRNYNEDVEKDLDVLVTQLCAGDGKVQDKLDNGAADGKYILCSKRVTRQLVGMDGEPTMKLSRSGKFVSSDPDVIERYYWQEAQSRLTGSVQKLKSRIERAIRRQPLLAARRDPLVLEAHEQMRLELPIGGGDTE